MSLDDLPDYLTPTDLEPFGFTADDIRRLCPWAVELVALDGGPCWSRDDLADLLSPPIREDQL